MGHIDPKRAYMRLAKKIDSLPTRSPETPALFAILNELYTPEEADLVARMPCGFSNLQRVAKVTGYRPEVLKGMLEALAHKGLVMDVWIEEEFKYSVSPMVIGIFEFTMMRTRGELDYKKWAAMFRDYLDGAFYEANFGDGQVISLMRAIPYEESVEAGDYTEVLDYEKAAAIVASHDRFAIGICSCRHEKLHTGSKECDTPLDTCSTFGMAADYWIRNGLAREVSRGEMMDNIARSKELGLVFCGDNVKHNVSFICHCCKCCCHALGGISRHGYAHAVMSSNYIARVDEASCNGCGKCARACPIDAIVMRESDRAATVRARTPAVDGEFCLGCGVCASKCPGGALKLAARKQRVLHPERVFERVILGSLERGTLQNQIFDDPGSVTHAFMRAFVGGFLRLGPVKRALVSESMRSRFLSLMARGVKAQGKGWTLEV